MSNNYKSNYKRDKWLRGAIPALLIHCSIGSVYAWSLFVNPIASQMNVDTSQVQFAFSLAIFFLGMSSAFCGKLVEQNIKKSAIISCICFCLGLIITGTSISYNSIIGIYIGYGCITGIGLGVGYITPIKTLMMWFKKNKGLGTGIAVMGFGFASSIASVIITNLLQHFSLAFSFVILSIIYFIPMLIAVFLLKKPNVVTQQDNSESSIKSNKTKQLIYLSSSFGKKPIQIPFKYSNVLKDKTFIKIWFIIFINISCGLALISSASPILNEQNLSIEVISAVVATMGIFNGLGRLILSVVSDKLAFRINIYTLMLVTTMVITIITFIFSLIGFLTIGMTIMTLLIVSAVYGAGFSCLPTLLSDIYGIQHISKIHALSLTAWAIAGLVGNQVSVLIKNLTGSYASVLLVMFVAYTIAVLISRSVFNDVKRNLSRLLNIDFTLRATKSFERINK